MNEPKTPADIYKLGKILYRGGHLGQALLMFRRGLDVSPGDPRFLSYVGLLTALVEHKTVEGEKLCRQAIDEQPYVGEWYVNLALIFERTRRKEKAVDILRTGLQAESGHTEVTKALARIHPRRKPVISLLDRDHPLNKVLGKVAYTLSGRKAS